MHGLTEKAFYDTRGWLKATPLHSLRHSLAVNCK